MSLPATCCFLSFLLEAIFKSSPSLKHEPLRSPLSPSALCQGWWFGYSHLVWGFIAPLSTAEPGPLGAPHHCCALFPKDGLPLQRH